MYYQISSIPTPHTPETLQSTEVDFGQFHDVDDEDVVNQKKDTNTGSNVSGNCMNTGSNVDDDDDDDMLDVDDNQTNANVVQDHQDVSNFEFESEVEVENTLTEGFCMDATKVIVLNACKIAGIELYRTKDRESNSKF